MSRKPSHPSVVPIISFKHNIFTSSILQKWFTNKETYCKFVQCNWKARSLIKTPFLKSQENCSALLGNMTRAGYKMEKILIFFFFKRSFFSMLYTYNLCDFLDVFLKRKKKESERFLRRYFNSTYFSNLVSRHSNTRLI